MFAKRPAGIDLVAIEKSEPRSITSSQGEGEHDGGGRMAERRQTATRR